MSTRAWTLTVAGTELRVVSIGSGHVELSADGIAVAVAAGRKARLHYGADTVTATSRAGRIHKVRMDFGAATAKRDDILKTARTMADVRAAFAEATTVEFDPPAGSFAARVHALQLGHPWRYVALRFVRSLAEYLVTVAGIGVVSGLIPLPTVDLPAPTLPGWLTWIVVGVGFAMSGIVAWIDARRIAKAARTKKTLATAVPSPVGPPIPVGQ